MNAVMAMRMKRQCLFQQADETAYEKLYRDLQPGQNVYWNGFGQPPVLSFRAAFDDLQWNRKRQMNRKLVKGRFAGGNLGWIVPEDMEIFLALYRKPMKTWTAEQEEILRLIETMGPLTIQQIKEETGMLVKFITPILHRLQEAFLIYEDQYDGEWDRGWYRFEEMFPEVNPQAYTRHEALKIVLRRFGYRMIWFDAGMAKAFYKLPEKDIRKAAEELVREGILFSHREGWMLTQDAPLLNLPEEIPPRCVYAMHRNDPLYKALEPVIRPGLEKQAETLPYDHELLQFLLIDGEFCGASAGHFRNGPYDVNDVICTHPQAEERKEEILQALRNVNFGKTPQRFMGKEIFE